MIVIRKFCEVIGHQYMFCESLNSCWCRKMHIFHNLLWEACWLVGFGYFTFLYVDFLHFLKFLLSLQSLCLKNDKCSTFHLFSIFLTLSQKDSVLKTSLMVQWLRFCTTNAGGIGSISNLGTKIPHAMSKVWPKRLRVWIC